ncbi:archease [Halomonas beimenensis]|uniref:Archease n=1 Tax=Halomonas beimenensis TaxID=475662 RepID=A0A291P4T6_9GAMM|nr:archease [Halomonas beimenensis]ATJ81934.1 archease [Halomonas beimenensis]
MWSHFPHGADIGIRGTGATPAEAFEQAALAMTAVITVPARVRCRKPVTVSCRAPDCELLLVDWLNALVYEMATRKMLFGRYRVELDGLSLVGTAWGEAIDIGRHRPAVEIKGATYTELAVRKVRPGRWYAQCVVDV